MKDTEIFDGFNISLITKSKGTDSYSVAEEIVVKSVRNPIKNRQDVEKRGKAFYENITKTTTAIFKEIIECIEKDLNPFSDEVQYIIAKHHKFSDQIHHSTQ